MNIIFFFQASKMNIVLFFFKDYFSLTHFSSNSSSPILAVFPPSPHLPSSPDPPTSAYPQKEQAFQGHQLNTVLQ